MSPSTKPGVGTFTGTAVDCLDPGCVSLLPPSTQLLPIQLLNICIVYSVNL